MSRELLSEARERRELAERVRSRASADLRRLAVAAVAAGVPVAEVARLAGVSRQTVYSWLEEEGRL